MNRNRAYAPRRQPMSAKEVIQYSLLGIIVVGGAVIVTRNFIKKKQAYSEERKTYEDGSAATFAKQIKMSFENDGWWGTDEEALRETLRKVPSKEEFRKVMSSYERLYNASLLRDMKSELTSSEYDEMIAIIAAKPEKYNSNTPAAISVVQYQSWARRLRAAFEIRYGPFPGTDEDAIKAVFLELPSQAAFNQVALAYRSEYGDDLAKDLKSELEFWEYVPMMQLLTRKPLQ